MLYYINRITQFVTIKPNEFSRFANANLIYSTCDPTKRRQSWQRLQLVLIFMLASVCLLFVGIDSVQAKPQLSIISARFKKQTLTVRGSYKGKKLPGDGLVKLYDRKLGSLLNQWNLLEIPAKKNKRFFRFVLNQPIDIPCAVRLSAEGTKNKFKKVTGARKKNCSTGKTAPIPTPPPSSSMQPNCEIIQPSVGTVLSANAVTTFKARLKANDPANQSLKYEWDFAGGAMERPTGTITGEKQIEAQPTFVRDNSTYRVRLAATDSAGQRCEAMVVVTVGKPPLVPTSVGTLATDSQKSAPASGQAGVLKTTGEKVVLPYEDWSMQSATDARLIPNNWVVMPAITNLKTQVFEKARLPRALNANEIEVSYKAASNSLDPVGADSINSTSQNWPVGSLLLQAEIQKTDLFETWVRPPEANHDFTDAYFNATWVNAISWLALGQTPPNGVADEGYHNPLQVPPLNPDHGRYMPGIANPYAANDAKRFSGFIEDERSFIARLLPTTDIDDAGRVNPYPLFRVEASQPDNQTPVAATDLTVTSGRDLHCRECHAKGGMAANPKIYAEHAGHGDHHSEPPTYFDSESLSLFDQEYAALKNISSLHDFKFEHHVGRSLVDWMDKGGEFQGLVASDHPEACANSGCHIGPLTQVPFNAELRMKNDAKTNGVDADPLSVNIHRFHGQLQYNDDKTDVLRDEFGSPERWKPEDGINQNAVFPVKDANGKPLPMEQNCLKCHGGQREQCYRDRMFTAGVTCYQCHGDMLAVSATYPKAKTNPDLIPRRIPWFDQPDCASCHTGNGNVGKDGSGGFFSAGVMKTAFDEADLSATPRQPDTVNPDNMRFAVPVKPIDINWLDEKTVGRDDAVYGITIKRLPQTPLFRLAKDLHGGVACAACHGGAHAIWPNRDPNANDNVTATQLQGHAGHIVECSVCHSADAFAKLENLDAGQFSGLPENTGILGGPHGMHPVNDPTWWSVASEESRGAGGWHDNVYHMAGFNGVDQCASCHGNDHAGTRLSKAAVYREFHLPTGITVSWKAGEAIGCDRCHTLEHSFNGGSPQGGLAVNRPPSFVSTPERTVNLGEPYSYNVAATDPDSDVLTFSLNEVPVDVNYRPAVQIDSKTGIVTGVFDADMINGAVPPFDLSYMVTVSDGRGGFAHQQVSVRLDCRTESTLVEGNCKSNHIEIQPDPDMPLGIQVGAFYTHRWQATHAKALPITYGLKNAPEGMSIDANTGVVTWQTLPTSTGYHAFTVIATDSQGAQSRSVSNVSVCTDKELWNSEQSFCQSPISITSVAPNGLNVGQNFSYQVVASHPDGLPLTYSLPVRAAGMSIDAQSGLMSWQVDSIKPGYFNAEILITDTNGGRASHQVSLTVCSALQHFDNDSGICKGPISILSSPEILGLNVGDVFQYQVVAEHMEGLPITYKLSYAPAGATINALGLVQWQAMSSPNGVDFGVTAGDGRGSDTDSFHGFSLQVCDAPTHWDVDQSACVE